MPILEAMPDYVYGGFLPKISRHIPQSAQSMRQDTTACGPDARWFEAAQTKSAVTMTTSGPNVDGQNFYELCQAYRHAVDVMPSQPGMPIAVAEAFQHIIDYIKTGKLPWPSHEGQP